ncbi:MAG: GAF domain-containing protein [Candidatus Rokubacteria bacterium]|nr:GAF domain-containing protein [Candidatus Rokubacteria bacterium]
MRTAADAGRARAPRPDEAETRTSGTERAPVRLASLRTRLLLLVLLAVLPAFALILYTGVERRALAVRAVEEDALRLTRIAAAEHERLIEGARQLLVALAQLPAVRASDSAGCAALFASLHQQDRRYANLGAIAPDGTVFCSALPLPGPVSLADRPYFRHARDAREFAVGDYQVGRITGVATVNFGYPVVDGTGAVRAVVFAALDLGWLNQLAASARLPPEGRLTVADRTGTILVASPDPERWVGRSLSAGSLFQAVQTGREGVVKGTILQGPPSLVAFTRLRGASEAGAAFLTVSIPERAAVAEANRLLARNLAALALVAGLALVAAWVAGDVFILRRVQALVRAATRLGAGDLSARTGLPHRNGELGQLARAFDEMADAITRRQRELEVLYALDRALAQALRTEDIARIAAEQVVPLLGFDAAAAFLLDERGQALRLFYAHGLPPAVQAELETIPVGAGVAGLAVKERRPVVVAIEAYPADAIPRGAAAIRAAGFRTLASTPLLAHGRVYGALTVGSRQHVEASEDLIALLASVGTQIGLEASHAAEREQLVTQDRLAALGRLAAGVAHELRNPLTVVEGRVALLRGQLASGALPGSERLSRHLAGLEDAVTRMQRVMTGLSTYAKPPKPEPQLLDVGDLLRATQELVTYPARKSGVTVSVDSPAVVPPIRGDRSQLMQILLNLATNATDAMAETGGQLALRARVEGVTADRPSRAVTVEVADTGPGIPPEKLPDIWEAFYTTKPEGTGLGLSIVRSLVAEQPGASIEVESRPGVGTTFTLLLPVASEASAKGA